MDRSVLGARPSGRFNGTICKTAGEENTRDQFPAKRPSGRAPGSYSFALAVDTTGAKFPATIDPVISLANERIRHPEPVQGDLFGVTLAAYGNLIAIGAPKHQVGAVPSAGVVYLFIRDNNCDEEWTLLQKIEPPNPYNNGQFGRALSIGHGALAISAHRLNIINGGDVLEDVMYVFQPSPTNSSVWTRRATLKDPDPNASVNPTNYFGYSISVNSQGSRVAIGSPLAWSEGGQFPFKTGKVFLHGRDTGGAENWGFIRTYQPTLFVPSARFGRAVALDGDRLAVGAPGYFSQPPNTNGSVFVIETSASAQGPAMDELPAPVLGGRLPCAALVNALPSPAISLPLPPRIPPRSWCMSGASPIPPVRLPCNGLTVS